MDKQNLLKDYKKQEDKMCLAHVLDKIETLNSTKNIQNTYFLDMYQISLVENFLRKIKFQNYNLYGGYKDAERKILLVYNEENDLKNIEETYNQILNIVRITLPKEQIGKLLHKNYLGAIVKLGLNRQKVGDILVFKDGADIITKNDFSNILQEELPKLTRFQDSNIEILEIGKLRKKEIKVENLQIIVPSLRLDNFVSDLAKTSRGKAVEIIKQERVFINGTNEIKPAKQVKQNDILTIRGKGRFIVKEFLGYTKSGRTIVNIEKWI